jgi:hypothetical protein
MASSDVPTVKPAIQKNHRAPDLHLCSKAFASDHELVLYKEGLQIKLLEKLPG